MQLFSVDQQRSQALEAHAAAFAQFKVRNFMFLSFLFLFLLGGKSLLFFLLSYTHMDMWILNISAYFVFDLIVA